MKAAAVQISPESVSFSRSGRKQAASRGGGEARPGQPEADLARAGSGLRNGNGSAAQRGVERETVVCAGGLAGVVTYSDVCKLKCKKEEEANHELSHYQPGGQPGGASRRRVVGAF